MGEQKLEERLSFDERYHNLGLIGSGGQGQVFKVEERATGRRYAAKRFILDNWEELQRLEDEVKALQRLQHPNLVAYQDHSALEENWSPELFLVTEYVEGKSLAQYQAEGKRFSEEEINGIKSQLVAGLTYAHSQSIVHRDIKPENILLTEEGIVKITDFGLAKFLGEKTRTKSAGKGSIYYMAPEQIFGRKITEATDYHGLGLLLVALASGKERTDDVRHQKPLDDIARLRKAGRYSAPFLESLELLVDESPEKRKGGLRIKEDIGETVGDVEKDEGMESDKKYLGGGDKVTEEMISYLFSFIACGMGSAVGIGISNLPIHPPVNAVVFFGGPLLMYTYRNALRPLGLKVGRGIKRLFSREERQAEKAAGIMSFHLVRGYDETGKPEKLIGRDHFFGEKKLYEMLEWKSQQYIVTVSYLYKPLGLLDLGPPMEIPLDSLGDIYRVLDYNKKKARVQKVTDEPLLTEIKKAYAVVDHSQEADMSGEFFGEFDKTSEQEEAVASLIK